MTAVFQARVQAAESRRRWQEVAAGGGGRRRRQEAAAAGGRRQAAARVLSPKRVALIPCKLTGILLMINKEGEPSIYTRYRP